MFKTILVFAGGLVLGALGASYLSGLNQGYEKGRNEFISDDDENPDSEEPAAAEA